MAQKPTPVIVKEEPLDSKDAKWIKLNKITYTTAPSPSSATPSSIPTTRTYESATRTTRPTHTPIDSIGICAIISRPYIGPHILLQKQFRPAIGRVCIEVPAGLIDESDKGPVEAAKRELREETGYVGELFGKEKSGAGENNDFHENDDDDDDDFTQTPTLYNDPGITNTNTVMVHMTIDPSSPENVNHEAQQQLEEGEESIECFEVPLKGLWRECRRLEREGYAIDARVGGLAEGIEIARRLGL